MGAPGVTCPACGRGNTAKGEIGFQRIECKCGSPVFVTVEADEARSELTCSLLHFNIESFSVFLKRVKKPVETFDVKTGLLYSGCDRAYVYSNGAVEAMPMARAKVYRWIQEFLTEHSA